MTDLEEWEEYDKTTMTFLLKSNSETSITDILKQAFGEIPSVYTIEIKTTFYPIKINILRELSSSACKYRFLRNF